MKAGKFIVALKDTSKNVIRDGKIIGEITLGKVLGKYRRLEDAQRDIYNLADNENVQYWRVGIFQNGKLVS